MLEKSNETVKVYHIQVSHPLEYDPLLWSHYFLKKLIIIVVVVVVFYLFIYCCFFGHSSLSYLQLV